MEIKELKFLSFPQELAQPEAHCQSSGEGVLGWPGWQEWEGHSPASTHGAQKAVQSQRDKPGTEETGSAHGWDAHGRASQEFSDSSRRGTGAEGDPTGRMCPGPGPERGLKGCCSQTLQPDSLSSHLLCG